MITLTKPEGEWPDESHPFRVAVSRAVERWAQTDRRVFGNVPTTHGGVGRYIPLSNFAEQQRDPGDGEWR